MESPVFENNYEFNDPLQVKIYDLLKQLIADGIADFYKDACRLIEIKQPFATTSNLVFHLSREIESALRDVLTEIVEKFPENEICVTCKKISRPSYKKEIQLILEALEIKESSELAKSWLRLTNDNEKLHKYAHRVNLNPSRPFDEDIKNRFVNFQNILFGVLSELEAHYIKIDLKLSELAKKPNPNKKDFERFLSKFPNNLMVHDRFFIELVSPQWLPILIAKGIFKKPPEPIYLEDGGYKFPQWKVLYYLKKVTNEVPQLVCDAIKEIPKTKNLFTEAYIIEIAIELPSKQKEQLKNHIISVFKTSETFILKEDLCAKYITRLVKEGDLDFAFELAGLYLDVLPVKKVGNYYQFQRPESKIDSWKYGQFLEKEYFLLAEKDSKTALHLLCDLLNKYYLLDPLISKRKDYNDNSIQKRQYIEKHERFDTSPDDYLLNSIIAIVSQQILDGKISINEMLKQFKRYKWKVFRRIELFILNNFKEIKIEIVEKYLINEKLFNDYETRNEYALLFAKEFSRLTAKQRNIIYKWIEEAKDYRRYHKRNKDLELYVLSWQRDKLSLIVDSLNRKWKTRYKEIIRIVEANSQKNGELDDSLLVTAPEFKASELLKMSDEELSKCLKEGGGEGNLNYLQLSRRDKLNGELGIAIKEDIQRFVRIAEIFADLNPLFGNTLIFALHYSNTNDISFDWHLLIKLFKKVVARNNDTELNFIKTGKWDTRTIISLIINGLKLNRIPENIKEDTWQIIKAITNDPDPKLKDEVTVDGSFIRQPFEIAINATRTNAIIAVIEFALWVYRVRKGLSEDNLLENIFDIIPDTREVLNKHLDISLELSPSIRSIYGFYFPQLIFISKEWALEKKETIFPIGHFNEPVYKAAWETYLMYAQLRNNIFYVLTPQYREAIENITIKKENDHNLPKEEKLAIHIMIAYLRGLLNLDDPQGLFLKFWNKADAELIKYMFSYFGRFLENDHLMTEQLNRYKNLWDFCILEVESGKRDKLKNVLPTFAWYFNSEKIEENWRVNQFIRILKINPKIDQGSGNFVIKRLLSIKSNFPEECLTILESIFPKDGTENYLIYSEMLNIKSILSFCINSSDEIISKKGKALVNKFSARGIYYFNELIPAA